MIIFGTRGVTTTKASGNFFCPECASRQPYKHQIVRRFFTLYFIPLIPLDMIGEYIECQTCRGTYKTRVLQYDPEQEVKQFRQEFNRALYHALLLTATVNGDIHPNQVETINVLSQRLFDEPISAQKIYHDAVNSPPNTRMLIESLSRLAPNLNDKGKDLIVKTTFLVALSDGEFNEAEMKVIAGIGLALRMSEYHVRAVLDGVTESLQDND
nr:hypothetical protein [Ardenticatena sp.]